MTPHSKAVLAALLFFAAFVIRTANAQQATGPIKAVQLTGLIGVKDNAKGTLNVENGQLHFVHGKESSNVSTNSIQDVVTGTDTQKAVGKTIGTISMAAPYESGRFLSLFRKKIDTLTVQYRDAEGGLHGAIFTMHVGGAEVIKKELVAQGARTATRQSDARPVESTNSPNKGEKQ
jgi:hypothetical protein